ncbi:hypothetical protein EAF00_010829 [Botryotinia globosa]|nr:hypothetical protein EAF00_010829 [Botryotinia globosa]
MIQELKIYHSSKLIKTRQNSSARKSSKKQSLNSTQSLHPSIPPLGSLSSVHSQIPIIPFLGLSILTHSLTSLPSKCTPSAHFLFSESPAFRILRPRDQETKRPRDHDTKRPRDQETKPPRYEETKRPRDQATTIRRLERMGHDGRKE